MNITDLRVDTYTTISNSVMRITHTPAGQVVSGETEESINKLKKSLIRELSLKVASCL